MTISSEEEKYLASMEAQMDQMIAEAADDPLMEFAYQMGKATVIPFIRHLLSANDKEFTKGETSVAVASTLSSMLELYLISGRHEHAKKDAFDILQSMMNRVFADGTYGDPGKVRKGTVQ
jgi:hypothetical protein